VAKDAVVLDTGARPDGSTTMYDAIAAGSVVEVTIAKGAGTATGDVVAGLNGFYSS
jgi:urea transporter